MDYEKVIKGMWPEARFIGFNFWGNPMYSIGETELGKPLTVVFSLGYDTLCIRTSDEVITTIKL